MARRNRVNPNAPRAAADLPVAAVPTLKITADDREIMLGLEAQIVPVARALGALNERKAAYLSRLADRLGVPLEAFEQGCAFDLDKLTFTPAPPKEQAT